MARAAGMVLRTLADDDGHFGFALEDGGGHIGQDHGVAIADDSGGCFVEGVEWCGFRACTVLHVVHGHAHDVARLRQRWWRTPAGERHGIAGAGRLLQAGAIRARTARSDC